MWCDSCRQDVPAISSGDADPRIVCAHCGGPLVRRRDADNDTPEAELAGFEEALESQHAGEEDDENLRLDDWQMEEDLRRAERLIGRVYPHRRREEGSGHSSADPHEQIATWHAQLDRPLVIPDWVDPATQRRRRSGASGLAWLLLSLGLMAFACGGVLLAWSAATGRGDLWNWGLPLALGGQAALLVGLLFQLEGVTSNNRQTTRSLDELADRLSELKQTTSLLSTTHSSAAASFYTHFADGADPNLLLADLKGQLDLLAVKMAKDKAA